LVTLNDFEPLAREVLSHMAFEYVAGGAGDEITLRANREAFDRIRLRPRFLVDVGSIDTRVTLFGRELTAPVMIAPCAYNKIIHPGGELEAIRGANLGGVSLVASTASSTSIEDMAAAAEQPLWFQLYASSDRGFTRALVDTAARPFALRWMRRYEGFGTGIRDAASNSPPESSVRICGD
jgi:4-hydroxymandelate oxidase